MTDIYIVIESESILCQQRCWFSNYQITQLPNYQLSSLNVREFPEDFVAFIDFFTFQLLQPLCAEGFYGK